MSKIVDTHSKKHKQRGFQNKKEAKNKNKQLSLYASNKQYYGKVLKAFGGGEFSVELLNGSIVSGNLALYMKRRKKDQSIWVVVGDYVLLEVANEHINGITYYEILRKYSDGEVKKLKEEGVLAIKGAEVYEEEEKEDEEIDFSTI